VKKITSLEPSTSTLVALVHFMVAALINRRVPDLDIRVRLYLQSITGDGEFARLIMKQKQDACSVIPKIAESIRASTASGDIADTPVPAPLRALFIDRLAAVIVSDLLPPVPAVDYGVPRDKLIEHAVWFALRG